MQTLQALPPVKVKDRPLDELSLAELKALRVRWLAEAHANGQIELIRLVVEFMGEIVDSPSGWSGWTFRRLDLGPVSIRASSGSTKFDVLRGKPIPILRIFVYYGPQLVARFDAELKAPAPDDLFIPGRWLEYVYKAADGAERVRDERRRSNLQDERDALLALLTIKE